MTTTRETLVLGGTGRIGSRVVNRLQKRGVPVRVGSRQGNPPFDWEDPATWEAAFDGVSSAYLMFSPEIGWPGSSQAIRAAAELAVGAGVQRLVLLSARGHDEAARCEEAVTRLPVEWTIVAPASFNQNFDEGVFRQPLLDGVLPLPFGDNTDPFIDVEDIADVVTAALTEPGHAGERYEVTGPRLLSFAEAVDEIARQTGRRLEYRPITRPEWTDEIAADGTPREVAELLSSLLTEFFDGRNSYVTDHVQRALGRPPRDFADWVAHVAPSGVWNS